MAVNGVLLQQVRQRHVDSFPEAGAAFPEDAGITVLPERSAAAWGLSDAVTIRGHLSRVTPSYWRLAFLTFCYSIPFIFPLRGVLPTCVCASVLP